MVTRLGPLHVQVLLCSWSRPAGSNGLMCCSFCASTTWILGTKEAGGLRTRCSSAVSVHSIGSRSEASLRGGPELQYSDAAGCADGTRNENSSHLGLVSDTSASFVTSCRFQASWTLYVCPPGFQSDVCAQYAVTELKGMSYVYSFIR